MKKLIRFCICVILFICFAGITCFAQKDKITGRWKPVRMVSEDIPGGIDIDWAEKKVYELRKERADSLGEELKMDAEDSAAIKELAKETINELFQSIYFHFNPDNTCYWNLGKYLDETEMEGTNIKGKYKIAEEAKSITFTMDKNQTVAGKEKKYKGGKFVFLYSFNKEIMRMEMDDGTLIFYLVKE